LSKNGWIRQRTGHDVEMTTLSFKDGDQLLARAQTRTVYPIVVLTAEGVPTVCLQPTFPVGAATACH
jgi:topoisomerase-4 subunit A